MSNRQCRGWAVSELVGDGWAGWKKIKDGLVELCLMSNGSSKSLQKTISRHQSPWSIDAVLCTQAVLHSDFPNTNQKNHCVLMIKGRQGWLLLTPRQASRSRFAARWFWGSICATPQEQSTTITGWRACTISWEPGFTACASVLIASRHNVGYRVITRWNCVISGRISWWNTALI